MPYSTFTVDDFSKDPYFIGWVVNPTNESDRFWHAFMADFPYKRADVQLAIEYIKAIHFQETDPSPADLARLKQRIWADITPPVRVVQWYRRPVWAVAAMIVIVASLGLGWWAYQATTRLTYQTAYGQLEQIKLADGSVVTLNANSSLRVADHLADAPVREVWLEGEAYFSIVKRNGATFIVHTPDAKVDVLGTEFNVNTRRDQTNVVLHRGKVQLTADNQLPVVMKPGDMAIVRPANQPIQLKKVYPEHYESWKESYIVLDGKTLPEITATLEDTFGVTIRLGDAQLANKQLTGKLRTTVAEDCIENLSIILDAEVEKSGDTYLLN